jgi:CBS domain-containing protein
MTVAEVLRQKGTEVTTIEPSRPVSDALTMLDSHNVGALVVSPDGRVVVGIVSERDVVRHLSRSGVAILDAAVSSIATTAGRTCTPNDSMDDIMAVMTDGRFRHVPVVVHGELAGLISIGDVVKRRLAELERANNQLESFIRGVPQ